MIPPLPLLSFIIKDFDAHQLSTFMWSLASLDFNPKNVMIQKVVSRFLEISHSFQPRALADLMWGISKMSIKVHPRMTRTLTVRNPCVPFTCLSSRPDMFRTATRSPAPSTLASPPLEQLEDHFLRTFEGRAHKVERQFKAHDISVLLWALAVLGVNGKNQLVAGLCGRISATANDLDPHELANLLVALTMMKCEVSPGASERLSVAIERNFHKLSPEDFIDVMWWAAALLPLILCSNQSSAPRGTCSCEGWIVACLAILSHIMVR